MLTTPRRIVACTLLAVALAATPAAARPLGHNGQIVFGRDDPLLEHVLYTINPDGSHEHQVLPFGLGAPEGRWSSDGSSIVTDGTATGDAALIVDSDTGTYRALPNPDPAAFDDVFACGVPSPDFERLACSALSRKDRSLNGIYTVRTSDGGGLRRLTSDTGEDIPGDYSPDGNRLVYDHFPGDERDGLYVINVNGTGARQIVPCCSSPGSWSPQGNQIVFNRRATPDVHSTLWVVHSDGSGLHQIQLPSGLGCGGPNGTPGSAGCTDPQWSPDGRKIVFRRIPDGARHGGDLYTINTDGTGLTQVTHDGDVEFPDWGTHPLAHD